MNRKKLIISFMVIILLGTIVHSQEEPKYDPYSDPMYYQSSDPINWDWDKVEWNMVDFSNSGLYTNSDFYDNLPNMRYSELDYSQVDYSQIDNHNNIDAPKYFSDTKCNYCSLDRGGQGITFSSSGITHPNGNFVSIPGNYLRGAMFIATEDGIEVQIPESVDYVNIPTTDDVTVDTQGRELLLPDGTKINGKLSYTSGKTFVKKGHYVLIEGVGVSAYYNNINIFLNSYKSPDVENGIAFAPDGLTIRTQGSVFLSRENAFSFSGFEGSKADILNFKKVSVVTVQEGVAHVRRGENLVVVDDGELKLNRNIGDASGETSLYIQTEDEEVIAMSQDGEIRYGNQFGEGIKQEIGEIRSLAREWGGFGALGTLKIYGVDIGVTEIVKVGLMAPLESTRQKIIRKYYSDSPWSNRENNVAIKRTFTQQQFNQLKNTMNSEYFKNLNHIDRINHVMEASFIITDSIDYQKITNINEKNQKISAALSLAARGLYGPSGEFEQEGTKKRWTYVWFSDSYSEEGVDISKQDILLPNMPFQSEGSYAFDKLGHFLMNAGERYYRPPTIEETDRMKKAAVILEVGQGIGIAKGWFRGVFDVGDIRADIGGINFASALQNGEVDIHKFDIRDWIYR